MSIANQEDRLIRSTRDLEEAIEKAIKKVGGRKENDLCKYLPMEKGGYMHHFTLRKMKTEQPDRLSSMIQKFIITVDKPGTVTPKTRAPRGTRKKGNHINLTKTDIERMLNIARLAGDKEMIAKLTPKKSLTAIKKEFIASIRQERVDYDLWNLYVEALSGGSPSVSFSNLHNPQNLAMHPHPSAQSMIAPMTQQQPAFGTYVSHNKSQQP